MTRWADAYASLEYRVFLHVASYYPYSLLAILLVAGLAQHHLSRNLEVTYAVKVN